MSHEQFTAELYESVLADLGDGPVVDVRMGAYWTAVVIELTGEKRCGLAASFFPDDHYHSGDFDMPHAGKLLNISARELADWVFSQRPMERSVGTAAVNALLPRLESQWTNGNAAELLAERGAGKNMVMVGHFPFAKKLREQVGTLWVLELNPHAGDLPADAAPEVIPQADVLVITATTMMNDTFAGLMALRKPDSSVMLLGPSTPLSPVLFDYGVDMLSGSAVSTNPDEIDAVLTTVCQGAAFRQVQTHGVQLVTLERPS